MTEQLRLQLLGGFQIIADDKPVSGVNTPRLQALLAYLVLHRQAPQSRQQLAYLFWPESADSQARTNLRNALFQLRNHLPDADNFLQIETQTIQWKSDAPLHCDVVAFEQALTTANNASDPTLAQFTLEEAIQLYVGDLLPGLYDDWILPLRERLQQSFATALEQLATRLEQQQNYPRAIEIAQRLIQLDPLREVSYTQLMRLHAATGDRAAALRVYHACASILDREMGVDPDPVTHQLYEHILKLEAPQTPTATRVRETSPLIGRDEAWASLQESWQRATRNQPQLLIVSGEAGIGKTRLVEEFSERLRRQAVTTAFAHSYASGGNLALAPVQEWLRDPSMRRALQGLEPIWLSEISRLLPELLVEQPDLTPPVLPNEAWQRGRLFDALTHAFTHAASADTHGPLLLVLDDIQWCDSETVEWLQHLLRQNPPPRLLIIGTLRQEAFDAQSTLASQINQLRRNGLTSEIAVHRLDAAQTAALANNLLGRQLEQSQSELLFSESEGNPLFIVELLRSNLAALDSRRAATKTSLPEKVLSVIESRLERLSPAALDLARVAAVIGRAFAVDVLAQASEIDEDRLVQSLDELWQQRVIGEQGGKNASGEWYDFSHDKIREVVYGGLSPMRRRFLHRRVAHAIEAHAAMIPGGVDAQIAEHFEQAGDIPQAIHWLRRAAHGAHQRSALGEATFHLQRALNLLEAMPASPQRTADELAIQSSLGSLLLATQGYAAPEVERAFSRAWELCQRSDDSNLRFRILWGLGRYYFVLPNPEKGLEVSRQLLAIAGETGDAGLLSEAACSLGTHLFHRAQFGEARHYLQLSLAHYDRTRHADHALIYGQDPCVVSLAYLAWTLWCLGEADAAAAQTIAALQLAKEINHPYSLVIATTYASVQQQFQDNAESCLAQAEEAIALADRYGFTLWLSMAKFLRGWAWTRLNRFDEGFAEMQESIQLFRSTGAELGAAYFAGLLAETLADNGQADLGLLAIGEALDLLERAQDRWCEAELLRIQAKLILLYGASLGDDSMRVEAKNILDSAIDIAQRQSARHWEERCRLAANGFEGTD